MKKFIFIILMPLFVSGCKNLNDCIKKSVYGQTPQSQRGEYYYKSYDDFNDEEEKRIQDYNLIRDNTP